jgi:hypothetical protein
VDDTGARIDLTVTFGHQTVLGKAQVRVQPTTPASAASPAS